MSTAAIRRSGVRYQDWHDRAACRGMDPDLFFPPESGGKAQARAAKAVCAGCPVTAACLRHALSFPEKYGIWGNLAERERYGMRPAASTPQPREVAA